MVGTRIFFGVCIAAALALGIGAFLTIPASSQTPLFQSSLAEGGSSSDEFAVGFALWRANGCAGCHTLLGVGGQYAPDLTLIASQRGGDYLHEFLLHPAAFHVGARSMPRFGLTRDESDALITFLSGVGGLAAAAGDAMFPPRPINITGMGSVGSTMNIGNGQPASASASDSPVERGRALFGGAPGNCASCHSLQPESVIVGPSLAGIAARAGARVPGQDAVTYLRSSILYPSDFIVPGFADLMAKNLGAQLTTEQIDDLIAFLLTLT